MLDCQRRLVVLSLIGLGLVACSDDMDDSPAPAAEDGAVEPDQGASQTPPQGVEAIEAWLAKGDYQDWHCEDETHASRDPSPHGFNRICSNDVIAAAADSDKAWPKGAAAVKELYASVDADEPVGYAVYLKTAADSEDGENWYWYERVPSDSAAPHDDKGVVADGKGDSGPARAICVSCHAAAGSDKLHTPTEGGRDQVYTPVQ